jgi:1-deoxy-D-xylulose-5-phosphate reductoisomerase
MTRGVTILGSTGSVGTATIDVIRANSEEFHVDALTAHRNVKLLAEQARNVKAKLAVVADEALYDDLKDAMAGTDIKTAAGASGVLEASAYGSSCTMAAIVGMAGLEPILAAIKGGKHVAIANKEPLVSAGPLVMEAAKKSGATLLPVDSEHNAIFQVFEKENRDNIARLILTASGGPFREWTLEQMEKATPAQALAHPNWTMGQKISIDSATMMNKALEVIEAHYLFSMSADKIDVLLHPQSVVHSMVEYAEGSILAQMGASDMRVPIAHALGWPGRIKGSAQRLDFSKFSTLNFGTVDERRFPAINYAYACIKEGQAACIALNAANEMAVSAFLAGTIGFTDIFAVVRRVVEETPRPVIDGLESVLAFDRKVRDSAQTCIVEKQHRNRKVS